jgi:hypothetical protein
LVATALVPAWLANYEWSIHVGDEDGIEGCAVWDAHMFFGQQEADNPDSILNILIPRDEQGNNLQCAMFVLNENYPLVSSITESPVPIETRQKTLRSILKKPKQNSTPASPKSRKTTKLHSIKKRSTK